MKVMNKLFIFLFTISFLIGATACGSYLTGSDDTPETQAAPEDQTVSDNQTTAADPATPAPDLNASPDKLLGNWIDVTDNSRFVKITKTETGFEYEDNEGKYTATYNDGVLNVQVSDGITADAFVDTKTGHLFTSYQDNTSEYKKK